MPMVITLGILGVGFLIGWAATAFRRGYLCLLGLGFLAWAGYRLVPRDQATARYALLALFLLLFVMAFVSAVAAARRQLAQLRDESAAREQAFFEMFQAAQAKGGGEAGPENEAAAEPASEEETAP
jgi:hypothetical protein